MIVGYLAALLGLTMTILPFGSLAFLPIVVALIAGFISLRLTGNSGGSKTASKVLLILGVTALLLGIYRTMFDKNVVAQDAEIIQQDEESLEDAKKELEDIEIDE